MRAVVQRVSSASVRVEGETVGAIEAGALILLGVLDGDSEREAEQLAEKVAGFRYFSDDSGRMNRSVLEVGGAMLVVSQFTLAADGKKRNSFYDNMRLKGKMIIGFYQVLHSLSATLNIAW